MIADCNFRYRSDYIFTLFLEGPGAWGYLALRDFSLVVEPSDFSAWLLIAQSSTLSHFGS
jgi:hypothetical protein